MKNLEGAKLISNLNSDYIETWGALNGTPRVLVYVEGWDDISFWRAIFDDFEEPGKQKYEIMTPDRNDMAKGKKVVLGFAQNAGKHLMLCVDSDFDYLFDQATFQSRMVNNHPYVVQTYTYAIENLLCLPSSLSSIATKITKNDTPIFDFDEFFARYSETIYPLFLWYIFSSRIDQPNIFTLTDFRNVVRINYLHLEDNGEKTILWLEKQVKFRLNQLRKRHSDCTPQVTEFEKLLTPKGVKPTQTHLYMQGHTLMDNVVKVVLQTVCNELRTITVNRISNSRSESITKRNEMGAYNNSLRDIDSVLVDNTLFKKSQHYVKIRERIESIAAQ